MFRIFSNVSNNEEFKCLGNYYQSVKSKKSRSVKKILLINNAFNVKYLWGKIDEISSKRWSTENPKQRQKSKIIEDTNSNDFEITG